MRVLIEKKQMPSVFTNNIERGRRTMPDEATLAMLGRSHVDEGNLPTPKPPPAPLEARSVASKSDEMLLKVMSWYNQNPNSFLAQIQPKTDTAGAFGFYFIQDRKLWNLIDEIFARSLTIQGAANLILSLINDREEGFFAVDPEDEEAVEIARLATRDLMLRRKANGWLALKQTMTIQALLAGFAVAEMDWAINAEGRLAPKHYKHRHPGLFAFDTDANLYKITGGDASGFERAEFGKFCLASTTGLYASPYGHSAAFAMRYDWFFSREAGRFWIRYADKFGFPLMVGKINDLPLDDEGNAQAQVKMDALSDALRDVPDCGAIVVPAGTTIDVLERSGAASGGATPHSSIMDCYEGRIVRYLLATDMLTEAPGQGEGGGYALGKVHEGLMQSRIKPTANLCVDAINDGVLTPYIVWNHGEQYVGRVVYRIDMDDAEDMTAIKDAVGVARETGLDISRKQLRDWTGWNRPVDDEDRMSLSGTDVYQYHIQYGIVTKNEVRAKLGLPPMEGGDVPVSPEELAAASMAAQSQAPAFADDPVAVPKAHKYSTTHVKFDAITAALIISIGRQIAPDIALRGEGREFDPHITVKYGIETDGPGAVFEALQGEPPIKAKLGRVSLFEPSESSGGAAVLKVDVISTDLERINEKIMRLVPCVTKHPIYIPHMTLAYVDPSFVITNPDAFDGIETTFERVVFSNRNGEEISIPLEESPTLFADDARMTPAERASHLRYLKRLDAIAEAMREMSREELATALTMGADQISGLAAADDSLASVSAGALEPLGITRVIELGIASSRALALRNALDSAAKFAPSLGKIPDGAAVAPIYEDAMSWMLGRKIATKQQVAELRDAVMAVEGMPGDIRRVTAAIREQAQAVAAATNENLGRIYAEHIAAAVNDGKTVGEFTEGLREALAKGEAPVPGAGYLENVYRTETAQAYQKQREAMWAGDDLDPYIGGFEFFNPNDDRSRPGHAALEGLVIRKGSAAHRALPPGPPFDFQCRCQMIAIMIADPQKNDVEESPDALGRVQAIETFE